MEAAQSIKQKIIYDIECLNKNYMLELQTFIQYLKFKQSTGIDATDEIPSLPSEDDPILGMIDSIDVPPFSDKIDEILYGAK